MFFDVVIVMILLELSRTSNFFLSKKYQYLGKTTNEVIQLKPRCPWQHSPYQKAALKYTRACIATAVKHTSLHTSIYLCRYPSHNIRFPLKLCSTKRTLEFLVQKQNAKHSIIISANVRATRADVWDNTHSSFVRTALLVRFN